RADLAVYEGMKARLVAAGAEVLHLTTSFRGVPALQEAINAAFATRMQEGVGQAAYVPLAPHPPPRAGAPALIARPAPHPYGDYGRMSSERIEGSYADAVAALVAELIARGTRVEERGVETPLAPRHVCLLFKRLQSMGKDIAFAYARALEARGLPHVLVGGR